MAGGGVGLGEITTLPVAAAMANAVHDATGVRQYELPIRPDRGAGRTVMTELRAGRTDLTERRRSGVSRGPVRDIGRDPELARIGWGADGSAEVAPATTATAWCSTSARVWRRIRPQWAPPRSPTTHWWTPTGEPGWPSPTCSPRTTHHGLEPGEQLTAVRLLPPVPGERAAHQRAISRTWAKWPLVEAAITGQPPTAANLAAAAQAAADGATLLPMTGYKLALLIATVEDTLARAAAQS